MAAEPGMGGDRKDNPEVTVEDVNDIMQVYGWVTLDKRCMGKIR